MIAHEKLRTSPDQVIHLEDSRMRRRERGELATEAATAAALLSAVNDSYARHDLNGFVALNAIAGTALAIAVIRGAIRMLRGQDAASDGANIVGVFGGIAAIIEGVQKLHSAQFTFGHKHFALGTLMVLAGLLTTLLALFMERMERRRALTISDSGIRMRLNKFRSFNVRWSEMAELRVGAKEARLMSSSGRGPSVVPLSRLLNRDEVAGALMDAARAHDVAVTTT